MRKPRLFASPPRPRSPRSLSRPEKLISLVSCATTTRRPRHACAVRAAASSKIACAFTRCELRKRCAATSAARSAPNLRGEREPELVISSSIRSNRRTIRMSPQNPAMPASQSERRSNHDTLRHSSEIYTKQNRLTCVNAVALRDPVGEGEAGVLTGYIGYRLSRIPEGGSRMVFVIRERSGGGWDHGGAVSYCGVAGARRRACPVSVLARSGRSGSGACGFADAERLDQRAHQPSFRRPRGCRSRLALDVHALWRRRPRLARSQRTSAGEGASGAGRRRGSLVGACGGPAELDVARLASEIERRTGVTISKSRLSV